MKPGLGDYRKATIKQMLVMLILVGLLGVILSACQPAQQAKVSKKKASKAAVPKTAPEDEVAIPEEPEPELSAEPYTDSERGFSIRPPEGWSTTKSENSSGILVGFVDERPDSTPDNIAVSHDDVPLDLDGLIDMFKTTLSQVPADENFGKEGEEVTSTTRVPVNGSQGAIIESTAMQFGMKVRSLRLVVPRNGKTWVVEATALDGVWDTNKGVLEASLLSFRLNP